MQTTTSKTYWFDCKEDFASKPEETEKHLIELFKEIITGGIEDPVIDMICIILKSPQRSKEEHYIDMLSAYAKAVIKYSQFKDLFVGFEPLKQIINTFETYHLDKSHPKDMLKQAQKIILLFQSMEREFDDDFYDMDKHEFID